MRFTNRGTYFVLMVLLGPSLSCRSESKEPAAAPKPPEVTISQVVERSVTDYDEFTGRMEAVDNVEVRARVHGYLDAVHFTDGQEVKAGKLLFEIDPRTFEADLKNAEGQKAQWIAKRDKAKSDVTRYEGLVPTGAASAQDLDKARAELGEAVAAIESAEATIDRAKLNLEFSKITAPVDGQVSRAFLTKGNYVQTGAGPEALLTTIVSMNPMYVYFGVNERTFLQFLKRRRDATFVSTSQPSVTDLKVPVHLGLASETGYPHEGIVDFADNRVDPGTGTIRVRAKLDNTSRPFKPGLFARVRVRVGEPYPALLVAQLAVATEQSQKYVLVVNDKNIVERRFVKLGPIQDDGLQVVSEGLQAGEWIVVNGLQRARPGKPITPQRAEMPRLRATTAPATSQKAEVTVDARRPR